MRGGSRFDARSRCNAAREVTKRLFFVFRSLPNTHLLLRGKPCGKVPDRLRSVIIGFRLVVRVRLLAE
jgi:hypothetical protein